MLEEGRYGSTAEFAEAEKIGCSFVSRLLRLTLLAPDIQEAILDGRQPKGLQLEELTKAMPARSGRRNMRVLECSHAACNGHHRPPASAPATVFSVH